MRATPSSVPTEFLTFLSAFPPPQFAEVELQEFKGATLIFYLQLLEIFKNKKIQLLFSLKPNILNIKLSIYILCYMSQNIHNNVCVVQVEQFKTGNSLLQIFAWQQKPGLK
jgi:hypothetical protein